MRYLIRERAIAARDGFCVADESGRDLLREFPWATTVPDRANVLRGQGLAALSR